MNQPLPKADLSSDFAKPNRGAQSSRTAGIAPPPTKRPKRRNTAPRPVEPVPDLEETEAVEQPSQQEPEPAEAAPAAVEATTQVAPPEQREKPVEPPQVTPAPEAPEEPAPVEQPAARRPAAKKAAKASKKPSAKTGKADPESPLVLWTPKSIRTRMQAEKTNNGTVYIVQVLKALNATHDRLPELLAKSEPEVEVVKGDLFEWEEPKQAEPRVQLTIRGMTTGQATGIDQLVKTTGANSRSHLVNTALDAYLPPLPVAPAPEEPAVQ